MSLQQVEIHRLASMLDVAPAALNFLQPCAPGALADLRRRVAAAGVERHRRSFERLAKASGLLPASLAARIAQEVMGPELVAQLTPYLPVERAVQVSQQMSIPFQAEVSVHMLPEASSDLLAALDAGTRRAVTRELLVRGEHAVMGAVVDYLPEAVIADLAQLIESAEALLEITSLVEDKRRLRGAVAVFPDERVGALLRVAHERNELAVLCELLAAAEPEQRERLSALLRSAPEALQTAWREAWSGLDTPAEPLI